MVRGTTRRPPHVYPKGAAKGLETPAFGGAERPAGGPKEGKRGGTCPRTIPLGSGIALRTAPTRRAASPHEMGDYHRDLV